MQGVSVAGWRSERIGGGLEVAERAACVCVWVYCEVAGSMLARILLSMLG